MCKQGTRYMIALPLPRAPDVCANRLMEPSNNVTTGVSTNLRSKPSLVTTVRILRLKQDLPPHYLQEVARLHQTELQAGLLAKLGTTFLVDFYRCFALERNCALFVAVDNDHVVGFISGTNDLGRFYRYFVLRYGLKLTRHLIPYLLRRRSLLPLVSIRRYFNSRSLRSLPVSELTSLAVDSSVQRSGIGRMLFAALQKHFHNSGVAAFKVTAATTQAEAIRFYNAVGATTVAKTRLGDLEAIVFVSSSNGVPVSV